MTKKNTYINRQSRPTHTQEFFSITSVSRQDLEYLDFDAKSLDDNTMQTLASKMADAYCDNCFWDDLKIIAEILGIPKKPVECDDCDGHGYYQSGGNYGHKCRKCKGTGEVAR